jgi:hypothetical protein
VLTSANTTLPNPGQEVHQPDLQTLVFDLTDIHRPTLKIEEDMEIENGLSVNQILEICCLEKWITFSRVSTFEINASRHREFL